MQKHEGRPQHPLRPRVLGRLHFITAPPETGLWFRAMAIVSASSRQCAKVVFGSVAAVLPPFAVSVLAYLVLALPDQTLDLYRDIAETIAQGPPDPKTYEYFAIWREPAIAWLAVVI